MKTEFSFEILHQVKDGKQTLTISPKHKGCGVKPKTIEVSVEQWNELKYHFMTAVNDKEKLTKLAYIN